MQRPQLARLAVVLAVLAIGSQIVPAQRVSTRPVKWRVSNRSWLRADPCKNPDGVPSQVTWLGSDGSKVSEERRHFCTPDAAAAGLDRRLDLWGTLNERLSSSGSGPVREFWMLIPDVAGDRNTVIDPATPKTLHYIRLAGREYFDLFGSDERHIRLVIEDMQQRFPNEWAGETQRSR